jgi:hypothetical protein
MITVITPSHIDRYSLPDCTRVEHIPHSAYIGDYSGFISQDSSTALIPDSDTSYTLLNTRTGESRIVDHGVTLKGCYALSPNGSSMAISKEYRFSNVIQDVSTGDVVCRTDDDIIKLCWSSNGQRVAYYRGDSNVFCIDVATSETIWSKEIESEDFINTMVFSEDGSTLVILFECDVFVLNAETGDVFSHLDCCCTDDVVCVSPDNTRALRFCYSGSSSVTVFSLEGGCEVEEDSESSDSGDDSEDDDSGSESEGSESSSNNSWDYPESGDVPEGDDSELVWRFESSIYTAAFSPDSESIIVVTEDGVYRISRIDDDSVAPERILELEDVQDASISFMEDEVILM